MYLILLILNVIQRLLQVIDFSFPKRNILTLLNENQIQVIVCYLIRFCLFLLLADSVVSTNMPSIQNPNSTNQNSSRLTTNEIQRPIVDLSAFVAFDFRFQQLKYESNEPFEGFLGDVENPWNIHIGNIEFIPKRDYMMAELQ